jgi:hypothetical protein
MADTTNRVTPGPLQVSGRMKTICAVLMFLGVVTFALTLMKNPARAWADYLAAYFYFFTIALGGLFFAALQHMTRAGWSVNVRRICESFTAFLPLAAIGAIGFLIGGAHIFEWMDKAKVASNELLQHKAGYLNTTFFVIRLVVFFGLWLLFAKELVGYSIRQDKTGEDNLTNKSVGWAVGFTLVFALSYSFISIDLLMSLQPEFYSTIFGVYMFAGLFQSTMAAMILLIQYLERKGLLAGWVNENHMHDLGKFLFAFTIFWAYIAYSQYMLIWYANLPEETLFYLPRVTGSWAWVSASLLLFKFVVPFVFMLPRWAKRQPKPLAAASILILIMQYVDIHWLIFPNIDANQVLFGLPELLIWAGFAGAFMFVVTRFLSKNAVVAFKDPRIQESLHHHVVY